MTTENNVAASAMSSEMRAPYRTRLKMSRPVIGSTPMGCSQLIPPKAP